MRIGNILYFSPKDKFIDLKWDDKDNLIDAFRDRVTGYYLKPATALNDTKYAFATGVMCGATIDFLARIETGMDEPGKRFEHWLKSNIQEFAASDPDNPSRTLARRFYDEFRNGLVHEGRIKNAGQFSYDFKNELVKVKDRIMIVNPDCLLNAIDGAFNKYMDKVGKEEFAFQAFRCALIRDFGRDVEYASR